MRSMTGYGRTEVIEAGLHFSVEIRSLNNRYLDVQIKSPRSFAALDQRVKKVVQERFSRGRFEVFVGRNGAQESSGRLLVNEALAEQYIGTLRGIKERFGLGGDVDIATVASFPDLVTVSESKEDPEILWKTLSGALNKALDDLERMRAEEGAALARDIVKRSETINSLIEEIKSRTPATVELVRKRITESLEKLLHDQPDPVRVAQEIAILAERTDVTEEVTRLDSHMTQFRTWLNDESREGIGRKLDFLIQEIGREVNTIASKAMDANISFVVVQIKAELEKIREQVQNIE